MNTEQENKETATVQLSRCEPFEPVGLDWTVRRVVAHLLRAARPDCRENPQRLIRVSLEHPD